MTPYRAGVTAASSRADLYRGLGTVAAAMSQPPDGRMISYSAGRVPGSVSAAERDGVETPKVIGMETSYLSGNNGELLRSVTFGPRETFKPNSLPC